MESNCGGLHDWTHLTGRFDGKPVMPLVRVSMNEGRSESERAAISEAIHQAMVETIKAPADGKFQILTEHGAGQVVYGPRYLGIERTAGVVIIQITLNAGRTVELKKALYARMTELLHEKADVRKEDVVISLVEVPKDNWSFGNGLAPYAG